MRVQSFTCLRRWEELNNVAIPKPEKLIFFLFFVLTLPVARWALDPPWERGWCYRRAGHTRDESCTLIARLFGRMMAEVLRAFPHPFLRRQWVQ